MDVSMKLISLLLIGLLYSPSFGQDLGAADSLKLVLKVPPVFGTNVPVVVECSVFVDANAPSILAFGWKWDNPNLQMDSAKASPQLDAMEIGPFFFLDDNLQTTNDSQIAICSGVSTVTLFPPAPNWRKLATYYMHISEWTGGNSLTIDTVQNANYAGTEYIFVLPNNDFYYPVWGGAITYSAGASCCVGTRGDVNYDGAEATFLDLIFIVNRIFRSGPAPFCVLEADVNSDGRSANIVDLTYLVDILYRSGPAPSACN